MQHPLPSALLFLTPRGKATQHASDYACHRRLGSRCHGQVSAGNRNLHRQPARMQDALEHSGWSGCGYARNPQTEHGQSHLCGMPGNDGGQPAREVAVQLLKPQNLWPRRASADWDAMSQALVEAARFGIDNIASLIKSGGRARSPLQGWQPERSPARRHARPGSFPKPHPRRRIPPRSRLHLRSKAASARPALHSDCDSSATRIASPRSHQPQPSVAIATGLDGGRSEGRFAPGVVPREPPASASAADPQLADLEDRSWQMMDSVLQVLRDQAEELVRVPLEEFRHQVQALVQDAEDRLKQRYGACPMTTSRPPSIHCAGNMADQLTHRRRESSPPKRPCTCPVE